MAIGGSRKHEKGLLMSSNIAIEVIGISKSFKIYDRPQDRLKQSLLRWRQYYREFKALDDISFNVNKGQTIGIIGKNGSGKSTLLEVICGTLMPSTGKVEVKGRVAALLELGAGFNPEFTGKENIYLNAAVLGLTGEEIRDKYEQITAFAEIGDFIDQPVKTYSSGMYVRLAFAIQANVDPEILIVDEALSVGDAYFVHKCMLRFNQLREKGTTILFVSHDSTAVKTLCDHAMWLEGGRIMYSGDASVAVDRYLAAVKKQPIVMDFTSDKEQGGGQAEGQISRGGALGETIIPNIDRRLGDQRCEFIGLGMYDENMQRLLTVENDSLLILRLTVRNNSLEEGRRLVLGYCLRNHRGVDLASNNSTVEDTIIMAPAVGDHRTIRIYIQLPVLHPGSYSFSITMGYKLENDVMQDSDSITNAVVFEMTSRRTVHVLMSLDSSFEVEEDERTAYE